MKAPPASSAMPSSVSMNTRRPGNSLLPDAIAATLKVVLSSRTARQSARREASKGRAGARQEVSKVRRQDVTMGEVGCHPKMRQDVARHLFAHKKTACLLTV